MIRVEDLEKRFGETRALDRVSFEIERGEVVGFLGPNGAGKSTTMRILTGYLAADFGQVEIGGQRVDADDPRSRHKVGYLPESTPLYKGMRVDRYLDFVGRARGMGRSERKAALGRVLEQCGLIQHAQRRIGVLSKGYRQRVGLAQALFGDPEVLILDEPTSGLDPGEIVRIRALVAELGREKTVLLSTHVLGEVQETCQRLLILAGGRLVANGSPLELAGAEEAGLRLTLGAVDADVGAVLSRVEGVLEVRAAGSDPSGARAFELSVDERASAATAVARAVHAEGWPLIELRHEVPSIERVFLQRIARVEEPKEPSAGPFGAGATAGASEPPAAGGAS